MNPLLPTIFMQDSKVVCTRQSLPLVSFLGLFCISVMVVCPPRSIKLLGVGKSGDLFMIKVYVVFSCIFYSEEGG